jgi:hypothetical protein
MATEDSSKTAQPFIELGVSGLKRWGGFVAEEFLRELRGPRGLKVYREMRDNSPDIGGCLGAIEMLLSQVPWTVEPFTQEREDRDRAEHLKTCLEDMSTSWAETIVEQLSMLTYGFAPCEIVYKRRLGDVNDPAGRSKYNDGRIGWRKIALRAQETIQEWIIDPPGGVQGFWQTAPPDFRRRAIPIEKVILFKARSEKGNPEGRSPLRNAYFSWFFCKKITELEAIGISRDLAGVPIGWIPPECFDPEAPAEKKAVKDAMERIVKNVQRDEEEGIVLPLDYQPNTSNKRYDLTLLSTGGRRQFDTTAILQRYKREMVQTLMHDIILMGEPNTITYKGKSIPNLFATALGGWLAALAGAYNSHAIPRLWTLNGWPTSRPAKLVPGDVEVPDLALLGDFVSKGVAAGFPWAKDRGIDARLRRAVDFPEPEPANEPDAPEDGAEDRE